jgi:hypothetical protein
VFPALLSAAFGCDPETCPNDESFVVDESGTCARAPTQFTLAAQMCRIFVQGESPLNGLPTRGAMSQHPRPLREGDFILYGDVPGLAPSPFRLCRAERVEFRLELTCLDAQGAPACTATLTEPGP